MVGLFIAEQKMSKKHKKAKKQVMSKLANVRAKTGKFVDWHKVDETVANPFDILGLFKRVWDIAIGRKSEVKN